MKTTIEISDPLLREARKLVEREGVTLRAPVGRGLRRVVAETKPGAPFKLRRARFRGRPRALGLRATRRLAKNLLRACGAQLLHLCVNALAVRPIRGRCRGS